MSADRLPIARSGVDLDPLFRSFAREGDRGRALRAQLAEQFPARSSEEVEDAVQQACQSFLEEAQGITTPDRAYAWLRTAAYRHLIHEVRRESRTLASDAAASYGRGPQANSGPRPARQRHPRA